MTGTKVSTAQDLVELLVNQHEQVKAVMPTVLTADGQQRVEAFAQVRRMLAVHEALEQESVHLLAKSEVGRDEAAARVKEETEAATAITTLEGLDVDSADFTQQYQTLVKDVVAHAEHEEQQEFNQLTGDLTDHAKDIVALAGQFLEGEGLQDDSFAQMFATAQQQFHQDD